MDCTLEESGKFGAASKVPVPTARLWWDELSRITGFNFWTVHEDFSLLSWLLLKTDVGVNQAISIPAVEAIVHAKDIDAVSEVHKSIHLM